MAAAGGVIAMYSGHVADGAVGSALGAWAGLEGTQAVESLDPEPAADPGAGTAVSAVPLPDSVGPRVS